MTPWFYLSRVFVQLEDAEDPAAGHCVVHMIQPSVTQAGHEDFKPKARDLPAGQWNRRDVAASFEA